jgi:threonine/homoserine/homoserine lactone efflux protein
MGLLGSLLSVSLGTANILAYFMLCVVAVFLISGPVIVYVLYRKSKRERTAAVPTPA